MTTKISTTSSIHTPHNHTNPLITLLTSLTLAFFLFPLSTARAQNALTPTRAYYQVNQPIPIQLHQTNATKTQLILLDPANKEIKRVDINPAEYSLDLLKSFPDLFNITEVHYLQLLENDKPSGSALVLQPLITRPKPVLKYDGRTPKVVKWQHPPKSQLIKSGLRIYTEPIIIVHTTDGDISLIMRPDQAPNTVWNFIQLVKNGFYTHIPFHRIVARTGNGSPFVIQAGDPSGTGSGGCAYNIDLEPSKLPHDLGVISMAREGLDIDTASSQFFICLSREGTKALDGQYTSFGQTIAGIDTITKLAQTPVGAQNRPIEMPYIESAQLTPAKPRTPNITPNWINKISNPNNKKQNEKR